MSELKFTMIIHSSNLKRSVQASVINHGQLYGNLWSLERDHATITFTIFLSIKTIIITINKITISVLSLLKCSLFQVFFLFIIFFFDVVDSNKVKNLTSVKEATSVLKCIDILQDENLFTPTDVIYMQFLCQEADCFDLYTKCVEYAECKQRALCYFKKPPGKVC